jgi:hypothetical protein
MSIEEIEAIEAKLVEALRESAIIHVNEEEV